MISEQEVRILLRGLGSFHGSNRTDHDMSEDCAGFLVEMFQESFARSVRLSCNPCVDGCMTEAGRAMLDLHKRCLLLDSQLGAKISLLLWLPLECRDRCG